MTAARSTCWSARGLTGVRLSCQILCDHDMTVRAISRLTAAAGPIQAPRRCPPSSRRRSAEAVSRVTSERLWRARRRHDYIDALVDSDASQWTLVSFATIAYCLVGPIPGVRDRCERNEASSTNVSVGVDERVDRGRSPRITHCVTRDTACVLRRRLEPEGAWAWIRGARRGG